MFELIEQRARAYFEDDPTQSALDYVACWIEDGHTLNDLSAELTTTLGYVVHREWIGTALRKQFGEDAVNARLTNARAHASHTLAEDALGISDAAATTSLDVARNGLRARSRQWTAERWNPQAYGQSKQTNIAISVTSLHLAALQHPSHTVTSRPISVVGPSSDARALPSQVPE
jgi:hypothetical protein